MVVSWNPPHSEFQALELELWSFRFQVVESGSLNFHLIRAISRPSKRQGRTSALAEARGRLRVDSTPSHIVPSAGSFFGGGTRRIIPA